MFIDIVMDSLDLMVTGRHHSFVHKLKGIPAQQKALTDLWETCDMPQVRQHQLQSRYLSHPLECGVVVWRES